MHNTNIKRLVNEIEDKVFNGKVKLYDVFKKFDKDNDGYVSYDDFEKCLKSIKVQASKEEISCVMKLIDKNDNGYLNFTEFSKTFSPTMSENLVSVPMRDTYHNNLYPSREVNQKNTMNQSKMQETQKDIRNGFQPDFDTSKYFIFEIFNLFQFLFIELVAPTRFSAKPDFGNTFANFQQDKGMPGFIKENDRFNTGFKFNNVLQKSGKDAVSSTLKNSLNTTVGFQGDDKHKARFLQEAKLDVKRRNQVNLEIQKANETQMIETGYQNKLMIKAANYDTYSKLAHIN